MKRLIAAALGIALALPAVATTTWSNTDAGVKAVCTTGSESAPTVVTQGASLAGTNGFAVHAETAGTMTAGSVFQAYLWNPVGGSTGQWNRAPDLDLTAQALASQAFAGFTVSSPLKGSRIAYVPVGVGVAVTIFVNVTVAK